MKLRRDPLTGDMLSWVERFSLRVQGVMRRWSFIILYTLVTVVWWTHPHWFGDGPTDGHWQDAASYAALLIESVVGIGMFGWARRDSMILRKVHALERKAEQQDENDHVLLHEILRQTTILVQIKREQTAVRKELENGQGNGND